MDNKVIIIIIIINACNKISAYYYKRAVLQY